tara:strand:+ start:2096 stop:2356 length:261 start_codon:yes stop_codon:yes gene_type:complete
LLEDVKAVVDMAELLNLDKSNKWRFQFPSNTRSLDGIFKIYQDDSGYIWILSGINYIKLEKEKADKLTYLSTLRNYNDTLYKIAYP